MSGARTLSTVNQSDIRVLPGRLAPTGTHDFDSSGAASIFVRAWGPRKGALHQGGTRVLRVAVSLRASEFLRKHPSSFSVDFYAAAGK